MQPIKVEVESGCVQVASSERFMPHHAHKSGRTFDSECQKMVHSIFAAMLNDDCSRCD